MKKRALYFLGACLLFGGIMNATNTTYKRPLLTPFFFKTTDKDVNPKMEYKYKKPAPVETADYKIEFLFIENQAVFSRMKIKITNKTNNYLVFDLGKISFKIGDKEYKHRSKKKVIKPKASKKISLKVDDKGGKMQVENFNVSIGGITQYNVNTTALKLEKYTLPPSKNTVEKGNFKLNMRKISKETDETMIKFKITYKGEKAALVDMSKAVFVKESGETHANVNSKSKPKLMFPGDSENVTLKAEMYRTKTFDMQFATFYIDWKDSIKELTGKELPVKNVPVEIDWGATKAN